MKKFLAALLLVAVAAAIGAGAILYDIARYADTPVESIPDTLFFEIRRGQSFEAVAGSLEDKGVIEHPRKFSLIARYTGHDKTIRYGEYRISPDMTPMDILERFSRGDVVLHRVTIPEGFGMHQIAKRMEQAELCDAERFMELATDPEFVSAVGIPAETLEGYLYPDTYFFERNPSAETVIRAMVRRFDETFTGQWKERAEALGYNVHEIVTLASIIEKETGNPEERTKVSSVFHNRLNRNMRLDSDPTVIYGIEDFDGRIRTRHLRTHTPYNTYTQRGLPPGPIASPGFESLYAALYPVETDYLFFVAKSRNEHHFSKTYDEHRQAVQKYILGN